MARLQSIAAEIDVPAVLEVPSNAKKVSVAARVTLRNTGEDDVVVHAASSDDRHFWHVFDANHREVLRERRTAPGRAKAMRKGGVHSFRTETVPGGQEIHSGRELALDAAKLRDGEVYTVRAEFFGHIAEASFSVVGVPASALRKLKPARKKPASKPGKTAKKKAGKTAKKAAAKKAAGKGAARGKRKKK